MFIDLLHVDTAGGFQFFQANNKYLVTIDVCIIDVAHVPGDEFHKHYPQLTLENLHTKIEWWNEQANYSASDNILIPSFKTIFPQATLSLDSSLDMVLMILILTHI